MQILALLAITLLFSQVTFAAAAIGGTPSVGIGTAQAAGVSNKALAVDPANLPPAGTQLAFVRNNQIYLVNADGTGLTQLTNTGAGVANSDPAWSRDGQRLAIARSDPGDDWNLTSDIYIMDADGSNVVQLTDGGYNVEPAWGPDNHTIAFAGKTSGSWSSMGVFVIDVAADGGQGSRILFDFPGWVSQPAWSPDGRTITFSSDYRAYDILFDLYAMNADGSDVRPLLEGPFFWVDGLMFYFQSAWSPDGQSIGVVVCSYAGDNCYPDSTIAVVNADGSGLRVIAHAGSYASPTWSPDGQWIAYGSSKCRAACQSSIRFVRIDGGIEGLIIDNGHSPAWRPEAGAQINVGHSGVWYNPATSGQGQFLQVEPDKQFVFLGWMTYTDDDSENPNEQHWFTAAGNYSGSQADLILYESVGGRFDHPQAVTTTPVGDVTLTFSDCDRGTMTYRFDDGAPEGSFPIIRAIPGSGSLCESRTESTTQGVIVNNGMDGAWFDTNTSGQGFFFDVHVGETGSKFIFISWFTYGDDTASGQRWLTAQGNFTGSTAAIDVYETTGGSFNRSQAVGVEKIGTMTIDFQDCNNALLSYVLTDEALQNSIAISRGIPGAQALCEELNTAK